MSYPYLSDAVRAFTGLDLPLPLPTFGLSVAAAVLVATVAFRKELRRQNAAGDLAGRGDAAHDPAALDDFAWSFSLTVLLAGIVGARIFHILEHLDQFQADPWGMVFSRSGLSVMGGLIFGAIAGVVVVRRAGLPVRPLLDAAAPSLMLGYGLGRVGCQVSGDGDWGHVANMALKPDWLPTWLWAQTYDNNIYGEVIPPPGVYPTPIYETAMALVLFAVLWRLRGHRFGKGWLFAVYLVLAGAERLLIEQIRVNPVVDFLGVHATQAQIISGLFLLAGVIGMVALSRPDGSGGARAPTRPT